VRTLPGWLPEAVFYVAGPIAGIGLPRPLNMSQALRLLR